MAEFEDRAGAENRFAAIFGHLAALTAYAARRGCADPEGVAAETMAIAWRRLADVPTGDPRPWLFATARNLAYAEWRGRRRTEPVDPGDLDLRGDGGEPVALAEDLDPAIAGALRQLSEVDREALLLIAWEELAPAQAAASLGINPAAFRVRLHRARRRFRAALEAGRPGEPSTSRCAPGGGLEARAMRMEEGR